MRATLILALASLALSANPSLVLGDEPNELAGASCAPWDTTITDGKYQTNVGGYEFKTGQTGTLGFTCPMTFPSDGDYDLFSYYSADDDGSSNTHYYVKAELRKRGKTSGTNTLMCTITSDGTGNDSNSCGSQSIDTDTYFYYVYITIFRDLTQTNSVRFNGLAWNLSV